jgi:hypothetical protein
VEGGLKVAEASVHHQPDCRLNRAFLPAGGTREIEIDGVGVGVELEAEVRVM